MRGLQWSHLLLNTDKTAHKVTALILIGVGIALAEFLGKRDREQSSQMVVTRQKRTGTKGTPGDSHNANSSHFR